MSREVTISLALACRTGAEKLPGLFWRNSAFEDRKNRFAMDSSSLFVPFVAGVVTGVADVF